MRAFVTTGSKPLQHRSAYVVLCFIGNDTCGSDLLDPYKNHLEIRADESVTKSYDGGSCRQIDPYEGYAATANELDIRLTAASLGLTQKTIRLSMQRPEMRRSWCSQLRFCPHCMSRGYHRVVHQFDGVGYCPVHGCCLQTRCRSCGSTSEYLIKASVLDATFKCPLATRSIADRQFFRGPSKTALESHFVRIQTVVNTLDS
ncbi:MAG: TniQ family protein [Rhodoferax sp.]|nr:TniQ family protein [Rhodoferax sp.]